MSASDLRLAGQRIVYSYAGPTPPAELLALIRAGEAGGVIFFGQNIVNQQQLRETVTTLQLAARQSPLKKPLLLMVDQEGGLIRRLPGPPLLSEKAVGEAADPLAAASQAGRDAGETLKDAGMNVNLSPVLDVYRRPGDLMDQYQRSYSRDPAVVGMLGAAFIEAQEQLRVAATAKHFPGLGAATAFQNTDRRKVSLDVPAEVLRTVDEEPYRRAIGAGVRLVMVSWATYPALDATRPAGLSPTIVQQELRERLGFHGVTVTDALGANALSAFGHSSERAVLAAGAGMDLILCAGKRVSEGQAAMHALAEALASGRLERQPFLDADARILALRSSLAAQD